ncbi:Gfo/Idh/MocA family oxidoreductase [Paraflavisolibacter sp. H34]|uniref:Gfo/Idh/MocA family protein n=1 Tax=Huijunlia imazamoxiresistens TaxID=3127457 RepID=UPI0030177CA5
MYTFALIGCGRIARRHAENIRKVGKLQAVCDTDPQKAGEFARLYGANAYSSLEDLLSHETTIDIVSICTPNGLHAEHSIAALRAGRHVLCEKPLCLSTASARQMIDAAAAADCKLYVVKQNRYNPAVRYVKELLEQNGLGTILSFEVNCFWNRPQAYYPGDWRGTRDLDGGLLFTQFSHFIDILYWFLGDVAAATGYRKNFHLRQHLQFEDTGVALLHLENGAIGTLHYTINAFEKNLEGSLTLIGEKGSVKIGGQYLNTLEWDTTGRGGSILEGQPSKAANDYGFYTGSMSNHDKVYEDLVRALNHHDHNLLEATEGAKTVEIIEKIYGATLECS